MGARISGGRERDGSRETSAPNKAIDSPESNAYMLAINHNVGATTAITPEKRRTTRGKFIDSKKGSDISSTATIATASQVCASLGKPLNVSGNFSNANNCNTSIATVQHASPNAA